MLAAQYSSIGIRKASTALVATLYSGTYWYRVSIGQLVPARYRQAGTGPTSAWTGMPACRYVSVLRKYYRPDADMFTV